MYKEVRISRFRGADDVVLDKLGRLNILVGRNNTGKSSCLEAISLMSSGQHLFMNAFGESALEQILERRVETDEDWGHLVRDGEKNAAVEGVLDSGAVETLEIAELPREMENGPAAEQTAELESRIRDKLSKLHENMQHGMYFYSRGGARVLGELYATDEIVRSETVPAARPGSRATVGPNLFIERPDLVPEELYEKVVRSGKIHDVISRLKTKVPDIADIRQIGGEIYIFFENMDKRPLSLMGDGFRATVLLSMSSHLLEGGTMAIEEPENHTHPALLYHIVAELLIGCRDYGNQVFLTTHSDELVEYALEVAPPEYVSVFQLIRSNGRTHVESFDTDEAREHRIKLGLDMRGM